AAHDAWVQPYASIVRVGQTAYVDLLLGNHSNEHRSYRIAGKLNPDDVRLLVYDPDGAEHSLNAAMFDAGEADATPPAGPKGYLSAAFVPQGPGIYVVAALTDSVLQHGDEPPFRSLRSAKTVLAAADVPLLERVRDFGGYDRAVADDRLEIIPRTNLAALTPGEEVVLEVRLEGEPAADQTVSVIRRSTAEAVDLVTDAAGVVRFAPPAPDYYLARVKFDDTAARQEGRYDKTTYEATLAFIVQAEPQQPAAATGGAGGWSWLLGGVVLGGAGTWLLAGRRGAKPS
ncbi:MAG TPA: DUF4198 domain-containing protein, partial [Bacillota bacterium]